MLLILLSYVYFCYYSPYAIFLLLLSSLALIYIYKTQNSVLLESTLHNTTCYIFVYSIIFFNACTVGKISIDFVSLPTYKEINGLSF